MSTKPGELQTDAFIVNDCGILQTVSTFYGTVLDSIDLTIPPHIRNREIISEQDQLNGGTMTTGFTYVEGSPFILVAVSRHQAAFKHWFYQRADVIWFLVASIAGILLVGSMRSRHIVNRLRESDIRRARIHHNLEYTNKMVTLGRLAAGVAHEINNALAIINEKAGLVRDIATHTEDFPRRDKILGIVDSITTSVDRCSRVTRRLLGFGRRMDAQKERVDLASLVNDVLEFQKTEAIYRRIQIDIDVAPDTQSIESDRGQLQQVFLNLISNAYAAVEDGGRIDITISQPNSNEVAVTISDDGAGIPENDLKSIFEPFFSTKGEAGTGLGLSITRDLVEKLGGLIEVTSEVGKGTRFTVNLPVDKVG
ncbi:MAG: ATP-binding protein [candidate division Zixibacteria bacterium]|nr:ATP-binding protein [candidate division Zixibacteria bacterium]